MQRGPAQRWCLVNLGCGTNVREPCAGGRSSRRRSTGHILDFDLPAASSQAGPAVRLPARTAPALRSRGRGCFPMSSSRDPPPFRPASVQGPQGEAGARSGSWRLRVALGVVGGGVGAAPRPSRTVSWRPLVTRRRTRASPGPLPGPWRTRPGGATKLTFPRSPRSLAHGPRASNGSDQRGMPACGPACIPPPTGEVREICVQGQTITGHSCPQALGDR